MDKLKEQWQASPLWQKFLVVASFSLIVAYGIYMTYISPLSDKISQTQQQIDELNQQVELAKKLSNQQQAMEISKKLQQLKTKLEQDKLKLEQFYKEIPTSPKVEELLEFISSQAKFNSLKVLFAGVEKEDEVYLSYDENTKSLKITPKEIPKDDKKAPEKPKQENNQSHENSILVKVLYVKVSLKGNDYKSVNRFLENLSKSERLITVNKVVFKKDNNYLNSDIDLNVYYIPKEEEENVENKK